MEIIGPLIALGTAIWVSIDASRLGARRGRLGGGFLDMGPVGWFFACLLIWIIGMPCYLVARPRLVAARQRERALAGNWPSTPYAPPAYGAPYSSPAYGPPYAPPAYGPSYPPAPGPEPVYGVPPGHTAPAGRISPEPVPTERTRALLEAGDITEQEYDALNRWRRR